MINEDLKRKLEQYCGFFGDEVDFIEIEEENKKRPLYIAS